MGNIDIKKTIAYYLYENINSFKPNSCKLVIWICDDCNIEKHKPYRNAISENLCRKCANKKKSLDSRWIRSQKLKILFKNNRHPLQGTKRPQHVIDALVKSHLGKHISIEHKEVLSKKFSGAGNPFYGKKHSKQTIEKLKQMQKLNARKGEKSNFYGKISHGKGNWYLCKDGSKVWMRSSWELKYAKYLDHHNVEWLYEIKKFDITYNNKNGTYTPDFFIVNENKFIEIKGWWRDDALMKYQSFLSKYPNISIELYDKIKLKELKIL